MSPSLQKARFATGSAGPPSGTVEALKSPTLPGFTLNVDDLFRTGDR